METSSKWQEDMEHRQDQLKIEMDEIKGKFPVKEGMVVANISLNIHLDSKQLPQTNGQRIHISGQVQMSKDVQVQATLTNLTATIEDVPTSWDCDTITNNLNKTSAMEQHGPDDFKLCASKTESIVIELTAAITLFRDQHTIKSALYSLLMKIIDAGKIDTNIPASITIKIENKATSKKTEQSPELSSNIFVNPESSATSSLIQPAMAMFEISFLQNIVLDVFPQIIREWIVRFLTDIKPKQFLKDLDLKSLYHITCIIQTSSLIKPPISGWHLDHPQPTEITPSDDLIRMMRVRDKVYRRPNSFVSKEEWDGHFKDILDVVNRFDKHLQKESDECFERQTHHLFNYWTFAMRVFQGLEDFELKMFEYALLTASPSESVERSHKDKPYWSSVTTTTSKASTDSGLGSERVIYLQKRPQKKQRRQSYLLKDTLTKNQFFTPPDMQMKESLEETAEFQAQSSVEFHSESDDEDSEVTHF